MLNSYIYCIKNVITNDSYIGSTNKFKRRMYEHFRKLKKNIHHSIVLQRAYNKYGFNSFKCEILEKVESKKTRKGYIFKYV